EASEVIDAGAHDDYRVIPHHDESLHLALDLLILRFAEVGQDCLQFRTRLHSGFENRLERTLAAGCPQVIQRRRVRFHRWWNLDAGRVYLDREARNRNCGGKRRAEERGRRIGRGLQSASIASIAIAPRATMPHRRVILWTAETLSRDDPYS